MRKPRKAYQQKYQREWLKARRDTWFRLNGPCKHCGSSENLELDHIDPNKKCTHSIWSWREGRRLAELEKCQALCKTCHKIKTAKDLQLRWKGKNRPAQQKIPDAKFLEVIALVKTGLSERKACAQVGITWSTWSVTKIKGYRAHIFKNSAVV